ncbi:MAG: peptide chain release factor N(5)-glutamine methyltransferase [Acidobacteriaceae bacterium]|jgi:release factor glutamine methyltransferase|nr:peptide chain release factor N(5)-glutamine methyltransferase [Acidobacteriaceae bacterium]
MASEPPSLTVGEASRQAIRFLSEHGIESPRLTAEVLLSRALGQDRVYLYAHPEAPLPELAWIHFGRWLHERTQGKPLQYITREQEFYGRRFTVGPGVLIPRPETELIVELALRNEPTTVLDIGTGSGILAITLALEWERPTVATDISAEALRIARANAEALGAPVQFVQADLAAAFAGHSFDAIVTNPPYVPAGDGPGLQREVRDWEPPTALFSGPDGLDHYRRLEPLCRRLLRPGGWLLGEFGYGQAAAIAELFQGWRAVELHADLAGTPRVLAART